MKHQEIKNLYNQIVKDKYSGQYEYNRWFKNSLLQSGYDMTKNFIQIHLLDTDIKFQNCLELGPGAGTWTKFLIAKYYNAEFDLVDISKEMLDLSKEALKNYNTINYFEADFLQFQTNKKYDLFFSSRALEYIIDKNAFIKKIMNILIDGSEAFIITKTPKYWRYKILGKKVSDMHKNQIAPNDFLRILEKNNARDVELYPVILVFPRSILLSKLIYKIFYKRKLNFLSQFFAESYCVKFKK